MMVNMSNLVIESKQSVDDTEDSPITPKQDRILKTDVSPSNSSDGKNKSRNTQSSIQQKRLTTPVPIKLNIGAPRLGSSNSSKKNPRLAAKRNKLL